MKMHFIYRQMQKPESSKQKISLGSKYNICRVPKAHNSMGVIWDTLRNTCQDVFHRLLYIQIEPISNWLFKFIYSLFYTEKNKPYLPSFSLASEKLPTNYVISKAV